MNIPLKTYPILIRLKPLTDHQQVAVNQRNFHFLKITSNDQQQRNRPAALEFLLNHYLSPVPLYQVPPVGLGQEGHVTAQVTWSAFDQWQSFELRTSEFRADFVGSDGDGTGPADYLN
jgi:hypothetical protein